MMENYLFNCGMCGATTVMCIMSGRMPSLLVPARQKLRKEKRQILNIKKTYTEDSIESLSPLAFTRLRPGVYVGSTEYSTQLLIEIVSNAVDEFRAGHGDKITVTIKKDNTFIVEDNGQGFITNLLREDGKTVLEAAFSVLNTSGKYTDDGVYDGVALGLNGIGSKLATYLSHWLEVFSWRDGKYEHIWFKEGVFNKRDCGDWKNVDKPSGTLVQWQPSEEFFTNIEVDLAAITKLFKVLACLCPGLTIILEQEDKPTQTFVSKAGLSDLADEAVKGKEILKNRLNIHYEGGKNKLDLVLTYTNAYSATIVPYVNAGLTDAGPHITQFKTTLTREMNKFFREKGWLKDKEENLSGDDCQEGLYVAFNITSPGVAYDAQTKSRLVKIDMKPFTSVIAEELGYWFVTNEKDLKIICDKALNARKARAAAKKARDAVREPKKKETGLRASLALSNKFIDCTSKDPKERKLFILEGVSAGAAAIEARNPKTDCIYLLRGKILSPLKSDTTKLLQNQEISDLVRIIGGSFGNTFDVNKINFDKIVIFSDSDSDGDQICLLLMGLFYTYMKDLVLAGKLYRGAAPLYTLTKGKEEHLFYTDKEYRNWQAKNSTSGYTVLRGKGTGEMNPDDLHRLCFNSERFKRFVVDNPEETNALLTILLGPAVPPRKQYIYDNATELGFHFE